MIFGGGKCVRDYVFVGDVARANLFALDKGDNDELNIGTGKPTDVNELFSNIKKAMGYEKDAESGPFREGDILANYLNAEKAKAILGWEPEVSLEEGVKRTYEYFKELK